jgi:nicotinate-nucleotide adenylyltransferase
MSSSAPKQRRVGILGGTFNPVHHGHLIMAEQALWQFNLDQVLWMPAGDPPHKPLAGGASKEDRLAMVKLAIADHERFACSDLEIRRPGPSYAIETLRCLIQEQPNTQWYWIIGVDALRDLPQWYQAEELAPPLSVDCCPSPLMLATLPRCCGRWLRSYPSRRRSWKPLP